MGRKSGPELLPGTLDLLILQALVAGSRHGYGIAHHLRSVSDDVMKRQELKSRGLDRAEADAAAHRALGNLPLTHDQVRDVWIAPWLQGVAQDIRYGLRTMNLPFTMTPAEAADCAESFGPKTAYPYHYAGQDFREFGAALSGSGIEVRPRNWYPVIRARR